MPVGVARSTCLPGGGLCAQRFDSGRRRDRATLGGYVPAFVGLAGFGLILRARELTLAAAVFAVSLTMRTLDDPLCGSFPNGTHFLWHCLNAIVLYLVSRYIIGKLTGALRDSPR